MRYLVGIVLLGVTVGCGSPYKRMEEARISSEFSDDTIHELVAALDDWCAADERLCLPVSVQDRGANIKPTRRKFCAETGDSSRTFLFVHKRPVIRLCVDKMRFPRQLLAHEIGHAMTGDQSHLERDKHIMSPKVDGSSRITDRDVDYVMSGAF